MRVAGLLAFVIACSSTPKPATPPPAPPSKCAKVADHFIELMSDAAKQAPTEQLDAMRKTFNDHCKSDGWSMQAQDCVLAATSRPEVGQQCASLLTPEQQSALMGAGSGS